MTNHRKLVLKLLAALIVLAGAMDASGVRLARPEYQGAEADIWIGYFLAWERLPGEGEVIPRNGEGWVEYGSQTMEVSGLGSASIPREILIGQYSEEKGFTFPGMEGYSAVLALVRGEYGNTLLAGNQLMDGKTHVSETSSSLSGAVCYGLPLGETQWPAGEPEYAWRAYDVFQMPDGTVYLDGTGNSYGAAGGMTITEERTETEAINGEERQVSLSVEVRFEVVGRLQEVRVKEFDASDRVTGETVFQAGELKEETAVALAEDTRWLVVEERFQDGDVTRTAYDAREIDGDGERRHPLVVLDERGMGSERSLCLSGGGQGTPAV